MKTMQKGFTLIELMIVVAIIAILAAIALPAYQNYTVRAKTTELMVAADACKTSIAEYFQSQGTLPPTQSASGCSNNTTRYIASLAVAANTGAITVTSQGATSGLPADAQGVTLTLTPTSNGAAAPLSWTCAGTLPNKYKPAACR